MRAVDECGQPKLVANWLNGNVRRFLNDAGDDFTTIVLKPRVLGRLIARVHEGVIHNNAAREVFKTIWRVEQDTPDVVDESIKLLGLEQVSDTSAIEAILDEVLAANPKSVEEYRAGKDKAFNALVGQAMKATKGKANPALVNELLKKKLG
jgi:aspartyl-tRNA(Asn)/glutamyl-tRNA(Gln) amidotransferase subunit B